MRIANHRLVDPAEGIRVEYREDPDAAKSGSLVPEIVCIHYAVTSSAQATAAVLEAREYVSCHVTLDATGLIIQQVPFNKIAWHAGTSLYKGRPKVSTFALGIEISNPGPLELKGGQYYTTWGKLWTGGVVEAWHPNDTHHRGWRYWCEYTQTEIDLTIHLCELFRQNYGIKDIVQHSDIAPGRKSDPGPAWPHQAVLDAVFPGRRYHIDEPDHDEKTKPDPPREPA